MSKGLKKGIILIFIANIINLSLSVIRNFILPKYLPIDTYADIKTYQLYISYAGFLAFGYIDGMYLKYGGKNIAQINFADFTESLSTFRILETLISFFLVCVGFIRHDTIFVTMALSILFLNIVDFYKCFFQAIGEFSLYSKVLNVSSIFIFAANMLLLFVVNEYSSAPYLWSYTAIYFGVWIFVEIYFSKKTQTPSLGIKFSQNQIRENISTGFVLMLGLFISGFMTGVDRWFVKFTMNTATFARYSFAASILGFLSYAVSPVSVTLYNFFCNNKQEEQRKIVKGIICVFAVALVACAFPVKFILETYLTEYYESTSVLFILFASQIFFTVIKCFYVNIYKAESKQSIFLKRMVAVLFIGIVLNIILYAIIRNELAYAIGTLLSACVWFCISGRDIEGAIEITQFIYLFSGIVLFIVFGVALKSYIGMLAYIACILVLSLSMLNRETKYLIKNAFSLIKKRK